MQNNNVHMSIVINGARDHNAREFISPLNRQHYVEGREGSNFTIRLQNKNAFRVLAIPSVDGLSVLDGKPAGQESPGFVLSANQSLDIPGWMVDGNTAAKFFFAGTKLNGDDESYAAQSGQDTANKGIIGLKVFKEKAPLYQPVYRSKGFAPADTMFGSSGSVMRSRGISMNSVSLSCSASAGSASAATSMANNNAIASAAVSAEAPHTPTLGTGFGDATDFNTVKTEFQRGDLIAMLVIYYDDKRGLKKVGIDVDQPIAQRPSAFPADEVGGCAPPSGWNR